jgi:hypothetical protein
MIPEEKLLRILESAKGDDLERVELAFQFYSEKEMNQEHGQSGSTRKEILDRYKQERAEWKAAYDLLQKLFGKIP